MSRCINSGIVYYPFPDTLELASQNITPEFELVYKATEEYGLKDLSPNSYADLVERWAELGHQQSLDWWTWVVICTKNTFLFSDETHLYVGLHTTPSIDSFWLNQMTWWIACDLFPGPSPLLKGPGNEGRDNVDVTDNLRSQPFACFGSMRSKGVIFPCHSTSEWLSLGSDL